MPHRLRHALHGLKVYLFGRKHDPQPSPTSAQHGKAQPSGQTSGGHPKERGAVPVRGSEDLARCSGGSESRYSWDFEDRDHHLNTSAPERSPQSVPGPDEGGSQDHAGLSQVSRDDAAPREPNSTTNTGAEPETTSKEWALEVLKSGLGSTQTPPGDTVDRAVDTRPAAVHEEVRPHVHTVYHPQRTRSIHIHEHRTIIQPIIDPEPKIGPAQHWIEDSDGGLQQLAVDDSGKPYHNQTTQVI